MNLSTVSLVVYIALGLGVTSAHAGPRADRVSPIPFVLARFEL